MSALSPTATAVSAFQISGSWCLRRRAADEGAVLTGDSEVLHRMQIPTRRLRAAAPGFSAVVADRKSAYLLSALKWIARALGRARDLDVIIGDT